ncbi:MAG: nuclear transport factor 2 family protein, partial [Actinobacteria bacterium]|nr:nuclear transport factor 2 family protein [Actinomycetota bacterium]
MQESKIRICRARFRPGSARDAPLGASHFAAEAAHDRPGILATLTIDAEHEPVGFPGAPFHGHDELMGFYEILFEQLEQLDVQPVR